MACDLDQLLRARDGDLGCDASVDTLAAYVELGLDRLKTPRVPMCSPRSTSSAARAAGPITTD